ncbi:ferredoxin-type protein NapF [Microvirga terricola]|uniref:Ferredoxin-type protein NapF n=1 Tax=Microvirga terricola TaxID=2719797 RepID=A0ABX0VDI6_9HYPH|nr:ferredoxin-type protein NapF [Microvirga terricola]NIX75927.1 ferredoxin-type protein NapF [Microvirga terricola]
MSSGINLGRRRFLTGRIVARASAIRPPWTTEETIASSCVHCEACVTACPQGILQLDADRLPAVDFSGAECTFCGACAAACPEPVFAEQNSAAFFHIAAIGEACFAARGIVCQSCGDACPENAIRFKARIGEPAQPVLSEDLCTGCGACIVTCPTSAITVSTRESRHA